MNGRPAADFDVALRPTRFRGREEGIELLYEARWAYCNRLDSSGLFFLVVPASWLRPGEPVALEVRADEPQTLYLSATNTERDEAEEAVPLAELSAPGRWG